jgi:hypothetical protein
MDVHEMSAEEREAAGVEVKPDDITLDLARKDEGHDD